MPPHFLKKNALTKSIGIRGTIEPSIGHFDLIQGDIILLCTDGLSNFVDDKTLFSIVQYNSGDIRCAAENLIKKAFANGSDDNISLILIKSNSNGKQ